MKKSALLICTLLLCTNVFAQGRVKADRTETNQPTRVLVETKKPYDQTIRDIQALGGTVEYQFNNIDALVAVLPDDRLEAFGRTAGIGAVVRDETIALEAPRAPERAGYGRLLRQADLDADGMIDLSGTYTEIAPDGYYPTDVDAVRASSFWAQTGHFGEGVIIGIMDSGVAPVSALGGRVIGGDNFTNDGIPATSASNGAHGTWVATSAGANAVFGFLATSPLVQALQRYMPEAVIPGAFGPGTAGVPMVGPAPAAQFYALKIFDPNGLTSNSIILKALDRTIDLKKMADAGDPNGVDIRVLNGSFGGGTTFAGDDPFFAGMMEQVTDAGIVAVLSAGNYGPSGLTGGDPGVARNVLTVGATSIAAYEKALVDLQLGPGLGELWRANDSHQTADFSSRGPTADGRTDPDITAPGAYIFAQSPTGGLSLVSGTSFSAPMVAGAAALLLSAFPDATPDQIRAALLAGANPDVLEDGSTSFDQGFGFLDVQAAYERFGAPNPPDRGLENPNVKANVQKLGLPVLSAHHASHTTGWLRPGQREELFVETKATDQGMSVTITVTPELAPEQQNQLFGDDAFVAIHSAKTGKIGAAGDYRAGTPGFVATSRTFTLEPSDLEEGLTRVTILGDWTNAGRIVAHVQITKDKGNQAKQASMNGQITQDGFTEHSLNVRPGTGQLHLTLDWLNGWNNWPTTDLDLYVFDPTGEMVLVENPNDGDLEGLSLDMPERVTIENPMPGEWTLLVNGFAVWSGKEKYSIVASTSAGAGKTGDVLATADELVDGYALTDAYPNPFNPQTQFTLEVASDQQVRVEVFNLLGQRVALLNDGTLASGAKHTFQFDASGLPSGMYVYRASGETFSVTRKMMLVK